MHELIGGEISALDLLFMPRENGAKRPEGSRHEILIRHELDLSVLSRKGQISTSSDVGVKIPTPVCAHSASKFMPG